MRKFCLTAAMSVSVLSPAALMGAPAASTIDVMFYNVYNLFDAQHDEDKNDWTFLPKDYPGKQEFCETITNDHYQEECRNSDWTEKSVEIKIQQLAEAIRAATGRTLPTMIGLSEIENDHVVGLLAEELGYDNYAVTNSPDERGIDVALMYKESTRIKFQGMEEHDVSGKGSNPTRNILEVEFKVGSETLRVFVNHWPSQSAPAEVRFDVATQLQAIIDRRLRSNRDDNILVMGDFNVIDGDYPHPLKGVLTERSARNPLREVHDLFWRSDASRTVKNKMPYGTYFYPPRMSWDRLDRFFVNTRLQDRKGLELDDASYRILTPEKIQQTMEFDNADYYSNGTTVTGTPYQADIYATSRRGAGYSDHFPIYVKLKI